MLRLNVPGAGDLLLDHLVLDVNGTLSSRGKAIDGVIPAVRALHGVLQPHVVSADTFGTAQALAVELGAPFRRICTGADKREYVRMLGAQSCVAIGNGRNDARMLSEAALGIAVLGPEDPYRSDARGGHRDAVGHRSTHAARRPTGTACDTTPVKRPGVGNVRADAPQSRARVRAGASSGR